MSPFFTPPTMSAKPFFLRPALMGGLIAIFSLFLLGGCSTPGQQLADAQIKALNTASASSEKGPQAPYLGSYGPNDPPRLAGSDAGYDQFSAELSDSVAVPFLSFLIIEPDPVTKNGIPSDIEKLVKAKKYPDAIDRINEQLKKTPGNVQLRYVKARMQIELRQWEAAKKTLIEITQQFPELPEPYNNLAAMAANQGNWIEARDYLELALKLRPSYTVAAANLGEVYIRLGAQAYDNAAKDAVINQRQYTNRSKALMDILKPPIKSGPPASQVVPAKSNLSNTK